MSRIVYYLLRPYKIPLALVTRLPYFNFIHKTEEYQHRVDFWFWFKQKVLNFGGNRKAYWPVHWTSRIYDVENIVVGIDSCPGYNGGAYITGLGGLTIGDYCIFAKNVIIVTANHDLHDTRKRIKAPVKIGSYCWLGAGAKIMPGVVLGDHTVVAAGAVVTKSFAEGYCVIGGVPARKLKDIDPSKCENYQYKRRFIGYYPENKFIKRKTID